MADMKRITLVTETCYPQINGVSRIVDQLISRLVEKGWKIQLLSPRYNDLNSGYQGVDTQKEFLSLPFPLYPEIRLPLVTRSAVGRVFDSFEPGVVHIFTEGPLGSAAMGAAGKRNLPVVTSYHTNFPTYMKHYRVPWLEGTCWAYLRRFHNRGRVCLAPTGDVSDLLQRNGFQNARAWGHGVDTDRFHSSRRSDTRRISFGVTEEETVFLYVGRIAPEKNIETLMEAFSLIPKSEKVKLMLVGEGPYEKKIRTMEGRRIGLLGFQAAKDLSEIYASSDVFVFPSLTDTFGLVVLEAMASGLPVAAFDVTGPNASVRNGRNGMLARDLTAEGLAGIMLRMHRDREGSREMGKRAREHALNNGWDEIMDRAIAIYNLVVAGERSAMRKKGTRVLGKLRQENRESGS